MKYDEDTYKLFPKLVLLDLIDIILDFSKELLTKYVHIDKEIITNNDIPLDTTDLTIINCKEFRAVDRFENIINIEISNSIIHSIPHMPKAIWVKCNNCHVKILGSLPKCEFLHGNCNNICYIENLISVTSLNLASNTSLKSLPFIPNCTWLNINETKIQKIIQPLNKCKVLKCCNNQIVSNILSSIKIIV